MANTLVYITDPQVPGGGYADRITGMAFLHRISESFNCNFKIHFNYPFDFFEVFPEQADNYRFDAALLNSKNQKIKVLNLIDENFNKGIDQLCKTLISENDTTALVFINNIKPFIFDPLFNEFIPINHNQLDSDEVERSVLFHFGEKFLDPKLECFGPNIHNILPILSEDTIGIQIRLGGNNPDWIDPSFNTPDLKNIYSKLIELRSNFSQILISSDNVTYRNSLYELLRYEWKTIYLDETPLHLERSSKDNDNFIDRTIGDHLLLRNCSAGVIICGGGYGRTAAILSGKPYFRI